MPLHRHLAVTLFALLALSTSADAQTRGEATDEAPTTEAPQSDTTPKNTDDAGDLERAPENSAPITDEASADNADPPPERRPSAAPATHIREDLRAGRTIVRHYVRTTTHDTTIERRQRTHTLHDLIREELRIEIRYGMNADDPAQIDVRVQTSSTSDPAAAPPLQGAAREQGLILACWQESFSTICRDQNEGRAEVQWPAWAVLDYDAWLTNIPVRTGSRWGRTLPSADVAGWDESHRGATRLQMEVQRPTPHATRNRVALEGTLETAAELSLYDEKKRFEAIGDLDATFNTRTELIDTFGIHWKSSLEHESVVNGEPTRWERETRVHLRVDTIPH